MLTEGYHQVSATRDLTSVPVQPPVGVLHHELGDGAGLVIADPYPAPDDKQGESGGAAVAGARLGSAAKEHQVALKDVLPLGGQHQDWWVVRSHPDTRLLGRSAG